MIRIKKKSIRNFFFLLAILLILFISAARPHNQPPRIELGGTVHLDCSPGCDYWDGHRWHCCGNGGGGPTSQPPTITAALLCARNGTNGWCRSGAQLQLSASDPQGYTVSIIGDVGNGVEFTCGSSCIEDLPEGTGTANYTATAATSNLTASGNTPWYYDATPPTATLIISSGTLGSTGWYTTPVVVTTGATDGISGVGPIVMSDNGSFSNTNSLTLGDGSHTVFTIVTDNAGNTASASLPPIHIDTTAPTFAPVISGTSVASGWYSGSVSVNANASDNASGIAAVSYQLDGGAWTSGSSVTANTSGSHIVIFRAADNAGNESTSAQQLFSIDNDPPVIAFTPNGTLGSNGWYLSNVSVGYVVTDALIGVGATQFTIDGVVDSSLANTKSGSLSALSDGPHNISVTANDLAGNAATQNLSLKIDTVPPSFSTAIFPTLPDGSNGWYKSPVALSATAADGGSGIASIDHQFDGGAWTSGAGFTVSSDGSHTVLFRATDQAGNSATLDPLPFQINHNHSLQIDQTPPQITFTPIGTLGTNSWYTSNVNVTMHVTDPTSGTLSSQYSVDGGAAISNADGAVVPFSDGLHTISVNAADAAGNSDTQSLNIKVDTVTPTLSVAVNPASPNGTNHWYTVPVSLNASASDSGSGMATIEYQLDGGTWTTGANITVSSDGSHTVLFRAIDAAGNTTLSSASSFQLDQAAPGSSFLAPASLQSATWSISGSSSDATSGLASAQISFDNGSSWNPLTLQAGAWSNSWDSSAQPNGNHAISVRATDQAGNVEKGAQLSVTLDNHPPLITLWPSRWNLNGSGSLSVQPNVIPLQSVTITIGDPEHRWADIVQTYDAAHIPSSISWDGLFANQVQAPYGGYSVIVNACDVNNVCGSVNGEIVHPKPIVKYFPPFVQNWFAPSAPIVAAAPVASAPTAIVIAAAPAPAKPTAAPVNQSISQSKVSAAPISVSSSSNSSSSNSSSDNSSLPWEAAALAALAGVTAYATTKKEPDDKPASETTASVVPIVSVAPIVSIVPAVFISKETTTNQTLNGTPPPPTTSTNPITDFLNGVGQGLNNLGNSIQQGWNSIGAGIQQTWKSLFGGGGNQSTPTPNPTLVQMVQGTAQALAAQSGIQTAQATPLSTSTATPPAMPTPSTPGMLEVTYAANLHLGNPYGPVDDPEQAIQPNTVVIPAGAEKSGPYGLMYKEVSVNGKTGWIVSNLLEPVPPKNAQPLVEDPSKKVVIDPKFSAGLQSVEFLNINKASLEANNKIESSASPDLALTNLCGEFAVAYITNQPIVNVLSDWVKKGQPPKNAPSVPVNPKETLLSTSTKGETSVYDLESMLDVYGRSYTPLINRNTADWTSIFQDQAVPGKPLIFTPEKIQAQLDRGQVLIIGVGIDGKGNIVITQSYDPTKSVPHWIIVEKVQPESATEGQVLIYNPYTNSEEPITFSDLTAGYKNFQGSDMPDGLFVSTSPSVSQIDNYPMFAKANYIIPNNVSSHNPQNKGTTTAAREELNKVTTYVQQKVVQPIQKALNDGASTFQKNIVQPVQKALNDGASSVKKNIIQPAQKALKKVTTTVQQKVVQPAQKALKKVTTTVQQKVVQPAQKALNQVNSVVQQKVIQPAKNFLNSLVSTVKNIGKPASTPKSTPSTPVQKTSAPVTKNQTSGRTNRRS